MAISLLVLGSLLLVLGMATPGYVKRHIDSYIQESTNGEYALNFQDIKANLYTRTIRIDSIELIPLHPDQYHYAVAASQLKASGISISDYLFRRKIHLDLLQLSNPDFRVFGTDTLSTKPIEKDDLYERLQPFFNESLQEVSVGEIKLIGAQLAQYRLNKQAETLNSINKLNIGVREFRMNKSILTQRKEFFAADDIYIQIADFKHALGDSLHRVHVDEVTYSIRNNSIDGTNFHLEPLADSTTNSSRYWISIPKIRLKSHDLRSIIDNDSVAIDDVVVDDARIRIAPGQKAKKINFRELKQYDLYDLIRNDFRHIGINKLQMAISTLEFEARDSLLDNAQLFEHIKIEANNFELNAHARTQTNKVLYSDQIDLNIGNYQLNLNDGVHHFSAQHIVVSTRDSLMKASDIHLLPDTTRQLLPLTVTLNCDSLQLSKVNAFELFHSREMQLGALQIFRPQFQLNQLSRSNESANIDQESLLYRFIGDYIRGVYAHEVAIHEGSLQFNDYRKKWDEGHISAKFEFRLQDFSIDSVSARQSDKLFYADQLELRFKNYQMRLADQLHRLRIGDMEVSSRHQRAIIRDLRLSPNRKTNVEQSLERRKRSETYDISIPLLSLENTDIHHAFFDKKLNINTFSIQNPKLIFETYARLRRQDKGFDSRDFLDLFNEYITDIRINRIAVDEGELQVTNHSRRQKTSTFNNRFSVRLNGFHLNEEQLNSNRLLFSDSFDLDINDYLFRLSDNVHYLKASQISLSSANQTAEIKNALLYPDASSPAYANLPWHLQISIPSIRLSAVDFKKAVFEETLNVGTVRFDKPTIQLYKNRRSDGKFNFKDFSLPLPKEMKELNIQKLELQGGKLQVYQNNKAKKTELAGAQLSFVLRDARLKRGENKQTARFSSTSIETNLKKLFVNPLQAPYQIQVDAISYSSDNTRLSLNGLKIESKGNAQQAIRQILLPELTFEQMDVVDAIDNNRFHARKIQVLNPVFSLNHQEREGHRNPLYIKLPKEVQAIMDELAAEKIDLTNASFLLHGKNGERKIDQVDILLNRMRLDSLQSTKPLGAQDITISRRNINYRDPENLYDFLIDRFTYSSASRDISLSGLHVTPRYSPSRFQDMLDYQQDYFSGDIARIRFNEINLDRWFEQREFTGSTIDIDRINLLVYRDKRKPENLQNRPKLPQELVKSIGLPFYFDTVRLSNSTFVYNEQTEEIPEPGRVTFEQLNARLFPFTNLRKAYTAQPQMTLDANCLLMGASKLDINLRFDMTAPANDFVAKGSLSPFDLREMNQITENAASISVKSGQLNRFEFDFSGDSVVANGKLRFAYEDLKVTILAHKDGNTKEARFLSFLANSLMLKSKSPRTSILLPDDIHYYRDPNKSTLNYWWKAIFSGAKNTFGVKEE